jgi:energy-coupling factor transporter ATP-binding protein EcfA2
VRDGVLLGVDKRGRPILWHPLAVKNAHMAVFGPMGSGKSTLARTLIIRAMRYFRERHGYQPLFLIVDPAGEYRSVARELGGEIVDMVGRKVNPLLLEGASPHERARFVAEMMRYLKGLRGEETSVLKEAILECYARSGIDANDPSTWSKGLDRDVTVSKVYGVLVERLRASLGGPMEPVYRSVVDKLRDVAEGARSFSRTDLTVDELFSRGGILCLSFRDIYGQVSEDLQRVIVWTVLQQLRDRLLAMDVQEELRVMVVMDEAHRFIRVGEIVEGGVRVPVEPPLSLHLRDTRKFGASYVMITHKPEDMPSGTVELVGTTIALGYPDHNYAKVVQEMMGLTPSQVDQLLSSARGQGFMKTSDDPRPLFLTVLPERGALVRDALRDRMALLGLAEEPAPIETPAPEKAGAAASVTVETPKRAAPVMEARAETPTEPKVVAAAPTAPIEIVAKPAREEAGPREAFAEALTQTPAAAPVEEVESRFKPEPAAPLEQRPVIRVRIVARPTAPARLSSASTVTIQPRYRPMVRGGGSA